MYHLDSFVFRRIEVANLRATVGRSVVDQDDFKVLISLLHEALDAMPHVSFNPVNRDNDADKRLIHHDSILWVALFTDANLAFFRKYRQRIL